MKSSTAVTPLVSSTLLSSEVHVEKPMQMCVSLTGESKVEETKDVTTAMDDVMNLIFQSTISWLIFNVETCRLDRSYYFDLIYKDEALKRNSVTSATDLF